MLYTTLGRAKLNNYTIVGERIIQPCFLDVLQTSIRRGERLVKKVFISATCTRGQIQLSVLVIVLPNELSATYSHLRLCLSNHSRLGYCVQPLPIFRSPKFRPGKSKRETVRLETKICPQFLYIIHHSTFLRNNIYQSDSNIAVVPLAGAPIRLDECVESDSRG